MQIYNCLITIQKESVYMISLNSISEDSSASASMSSWIAKLQEGKKSTQQLQMDMLDSAIEQINKLQEAALEKAEEKREEELKENQKNENAVEVSVSSVSVSSTSDVADVEQTSSVEVEA